MATSPSSTTLEALLKRDRLIVIGGLVTVIALAWIYILLGAGMGMSAFEMTVMSQGAKSQGTMSQGTMSQGGRGTMEMAPPQPPTGEAAGGASMMDMAMTAMQPMAWTPGYAVLMFFMWWIMMVAMMLPSAAPMILLFASVNRKQQARGAPFVPTGIFALGYLGVWAGFSLVAVALQWALEQTALLSSAMASTSLALGAILLIAAGVWQLTPLKHACLRHCRAPIFFLAHHWRSGRLGALRMGLEHGAFCLGCCWFLMGLLFYGGVMNLYWIIGLALYVLLEKTLPAGHRVGSAIGVLLIIWGGALLVGTF